MSWLRDIFSPTNLWSLFKYCFPTAASILSGWLSWIWGLPPPVIILLAVLTAACVLIIFDFFQDWFNKRNSHLLRIKELEERLKPKIKVLGISERRDPDAGRIFELEIKHDSEEELPNCLAKVTSISLFKMNPDGTEIDYSAPYRHDLPLALRTARNVGRDGGGPFHLRPQETKKVPICARQDGFGRDLQISFESGVPEVFKNITLISSGDLEIEVYGAPSPPKERLHLALDNGKLKVTRNV